MKIVAQSYQTENQNITFKKVRFDFASRSDRTQYGTMIYQAIDNDRWSRRICDNRLLKKLSDKNRQRFRDIITNEVMALLLLELG